MQILLMSKKTLLVGLFALTTASTLAAKPITYYVEGNENDPDIKKNVPTIKKPAPPSVALVGGGWDVAEAFRWMITRAGITNNEKGRFLVIRATGTNAYNPYIFSVLGTMDPTSPHENVGGKSMGVASAATMIVPSRDAANDDFAVAKIADAHAIFIAGGNQADYHNYWAGSKMMVALQDAIDRGVPVGGTSAGAAVLGEYAFVALRGTVTSADVLLDPYDSDATINPLNTATKKVSNPDSLVRIPSLANIIVDQHLNTRDRLGRMMSFVARIEKGVCAGGMEQPTTVIGVGLAEETALLISGTGDKVIAQLAANPYNSATNAPGYDPSYSAYFTRYTLQPENCKAGTPLKASSVQMYRMSAQQNHSSKPKNHSFMTEATFNLSVKSWDNNLAKVFPDRSTLNGSFLLGADKGVVIRPNGMTHY